MGKETGDDKYGIDLNSLVTIEILCPDSMS